MRDIHGYTAKVTIDAKNDMVFKHIGKGRYKGYSKEFIKELIDREVFWLKKLAHLKFVPRLYAYDEKHIMMSYCGEVVTEKPKDYYEQLNKIKTLLLQNHCYYNDWKPDNLLIKKGNLYLIDFGWASLIKEDMSCGGIVKTKLKCKPVKNNFRL